MSIRVLVVDDEAMVRVGLRLVLQAEPDIEVVGEAADGVEALAATLELHPDVVLTTFTDDASMRQALRAGASGFLLKVAPPQRLAEAVRVAAHGDALLGPLVTRSVIEAFAAVPEPASPAPTPPPELDLLTVRELEVLHMLARGMSNAEIAAQLVVGDATVKTHVARVLMKLQIPDRVQAVVFAYENRVVPCTDN